MAVERRRACGFRKVGGLYLMGAGDGVACDRLPIYLEVCPCCSQGIKQTRGWTWIDVALLVGGVHSDCTDEFPCPLCMATERMGRAGLLWIGEKFYPTVEEFMREAADQGISRRITAVPRGFKVGETWVLLAHPKGATCPACAGSGAASAEFELSAEAPAKCERCKGAGKVPAIFRVFRPHAVEKILTESQATEEALAELREKGITPVIVPDNDKDHQGTVYDDDAGEAENGKGAAA